MRHPQNKSFKSSALASASLSTTTDATKFDSRTAIQSNNKQSNNSSNNNNNKQSNNSSNNNSKKIASSSNTNKKSKVVTTTSFQPKTIDVVNDENGQKSPDYNTNGIDSNLLQPGVSVTFGQLDSSKISGTISARKGERLEILYSASTGRYVIHVGAVLCFFGEENVIPIEVTGCRIVNSDYGAVKTIYAAKLLGYRNINEIEEGGYGWNKLKDSSAYRKFIHSKDTTGNKHSRPSSRQDSAMAGHGFDENTFFSPKVSREKADNSTGLTPQLRTAELHDALNAGGELFSDDMVVEGGSGGYTPTTQHPSLSLQGYSNQTPVDANNNLGDNDIDLGGDTVHQLKSDFAGGASAAHNDMVLQSPSISNQPLTGLPHPPQPPEEEQPAVPSSSNNKERLIDALVTKASSSVVQNVISHPLVQFMLEESTVADEIASIDDLKKYYSNVRINYLNNPNHFIDTHATSKLKRVAITNHGSVVDGIESFEKAQLARIVVLLVLIPSMGMKISKAKREYEKQRAQLAASLAIGIIGNAEDIGNEDNNIFKTSRTGGYEIHMNYNGTQRTGTGIHFTCKSKEHAILVKKELCELLTDTDTSFIYLSGKLKGNICDLSVPVGQDSEDKVEYVKALAKERLINTGNFNDYKPDWLTPSWSNTQDNALKDFVLSGMIGKNVSNELKDRKMSMCSRIYIGVDWEAASHVFQK